MLLRMKISRSCILWGPMCIRRKKNNFSFRSRAWLLSLGDVPLAMDNANRRSCSQEALWLEQSQFVHVSQWESQKYHNRMPLSNLLLAGAVVFSGINFSKCLRFLKHLNVPAICPSTFSRIQSAYVVPATLFTLDFHQTELLDQYQGRVLTLGGDARCDSPGFSAKFGSYTLMDLELGKVVDFQLVQVIMKIIISCHIKRQYCKLFLRIR